MLHAGLHVTCRQWSRAGAVAARGWKARGSKAREEQQDVQQPGRSELTAGTGGWGVGEVVVWQDQARHVEDHEDSELGKRLCTAVP